MTEKLYNVFNKNTKEFIRSTFAFAETIKNKFVILQETKEIPVYVEPELEDGWYLVTVRSTEEIYAREKRNEEGYTKDGVKGGDWEIYKVLAKLNDIEWVEDGVD